MNMVATDPRHHLSLEILFIATDAVDM